MFSFKNLLAKKSFPKVAHYSDAPVRSWQDIPLGVDIKGKTLYWDTQLKPHLLITGRTGSGKSILLQNIIAHSIEHKGHFMLVGIDIYKKNLAAYEKYAPLVAGVATNMEDARTACQFIYDEMMKRYLLTEQAGVDNILDLPGFPEGHMLLVIDELSALLRKTGLEKDAAEDAVRDEITRMLTEITRLGRAAGIQLVLTSQQHDRKIITNELWDNIHTRAVMGSIDYTAWGRGYFQTRGIDGIEFQAYLATDEWMDEQYAKSGIVPAKDEGEKNAGENTEKS